MKKTLLALALALTTPLVAWAENPIFKDIFTADPAAFVYQGRLYLYTGHDEAKPGDKKFVMKDWRCWSTDDMKTWRAEGVPMSLKTFEWARSDAWASQVIERGGKFYWYAATYPKGGSGFAIAVGVADSPTGPFKDALGKPLVVNEMTRGAINEKTGREINWDDIDPTVWIDEVPVSAESPDGKQAYLVWGNTRCRIAKLKANMTELAGEITNIDLPKFTEAPWIHKYKGTYYLSYAYDYPEKIAYATAAKIEGPYAFGGVINELVPFSNTNHQAIVEFKEKWYFFYHTAALSKDEWRRSVCVEELKYDGEGRIVPVVQTGGTTETRKGIAEGK